MAAASRGACHGERRRRVDSTRKKHDRVGHSRNRLVHICARTKSPVRSSPSRTPRCTTGSTGAAAKTWASIACSPTSAAARSSTSAAARGASWCRCSETATSSWASTTRPRCWRAPPRRSRGWRPPSAPARAAGARRPAPLRLRGDPRQPAVRRAPAPFGFAIVAFHGIQHLVTDAELLGFLRHVRAALIPGGWLAFDVFAPDPAFMARVREAGPARRWHRTLFRHPVTGRREAYAASYAFDARRATLLTTFHYQPVDALGRRRGPERHVRLCHRQLEPKAVRGRFIVARRPRAARQLGGFRGAGPLRRRRRQRAACSSGAKSLTCSRTRAGGRAKSAGNTVKKPCLRRNSDGISLDRGSPPATMPRSSFANFLTEGYRDGRESRKVRREP